MAPMTGPSIQTELGASIMTSPVIMMLAVETLRAMPSCGCSVTPKRFRGCGKTLDAIDFFFAGVRFFFEGVFSLSVGIDMC